MLEKILRWYYSHKKINLDFKIINAKEGQVNPLIIVVTANKPEQYWSEDEAGNVAVVREHLADIGYCVIVRWL